MCCFMYFMDGPFANPDPEDDGREPLEQDDAFLDQLRGVAHTHKPEYDRASNEGLRRFHNYGEGPHSGLLLVVSTY